MSPLSLASLPASLVRAEVAHPDAAGPAEGHERRAATWFVVGVMILAVLAAVFGG